MFVRWLPTDSRMGLLHGGSISGSGCGAAVLSQSPTIVVLLLFREVAAVCWESPFLVVSLPFSIASLGYGRVACSNDMMMELVDKIFDVTDLASFVHAQKDENRVKLHLMFREAMRASGKDLEKLSVYSGIIGNVGTEDFYFDIGFVVEENFLSPSLHQTYWKIHRGNRHSQGA
jgi:hypothetical protein